ncbi:Alcohol dehydrogenase 2 [Propionispora sp. 2/2-37]|uniref:iron-containing alcohol dehydrogenase n=1 Tax=Propionispora sp. 2/2-37 TaxID=1677858 RepID=UPI0006BB5C4C|nr:iron-containing alcohol dehydrogenase [Propionispora sp. 2/2-37]CUH94341.1 Alcohol dehydrogenase 2 [Propionispora sp. 2/2-37]
MANHRRIREYFMTPVSLLGAGCLSEITRYIKPMMFRKAFIVSDKVLVDSKLIDKLTDQLAPAGIHYILYDNVAPNPTTAQVNYGLKLYLDNGCDFLISFGGGSPHDCAKAIALLATNGKSIHDYEGLNKAKQPTAPLITVNTTAGTGSELTRFCVITDEERHVKMTITDWRLTPLLAINDAELMVNMPPSLTAATGIDALTHAVEAYVSLNASPVTDCKALQAVELIGAHLQSAVTNGQDLTAREMMVYGEYLAGIAFNNASVGYVHALAHQLGGRYNYPHGLANALMLPAVMAFNLPVVAAKYAKVARALGVDTSGLTPEAAAIEAVQSVRKLIRNVGIVSGLQQIKGFREEDIPLLAENAARDICAATNPRQATLEELGMIYHWAL